MGLTGLTSGMSLVWLLMGCLNIFSIVWFSKKSLVVQLPISLKKGIKFWYFTRFVVPPVLDVSEMCHVFRYKKLSEFSDKWVSYPFDFHKFKECI